MFKQVVVGGFVAFLGALLIFYSQAVSELFGRVEWFERHMGSTRNGYVLFGFGIIVIGFLIVFGVFPIGGPSPTDTPMSASVQTTQ